MKDFIQSLFKLTEERIKNPLIGSFIVSWIIFNWKPIVYFLLSSERVLQKIKFIESNYSNNLHILWIPLIASIFYILVLPYLSLLIEKLLTYSIRKRNENNIENKLQEIFNQDKIALANIDLEMNKSAYREKFKHNNLIEELEGKIKELEFKSKNDKAINNKVIDELKVELMASENRFKEEQVKSEQRSSELQKKIIELNNSLYKKQNLKIIDYDFVPIKDRLQNSIYFENGRTLLEKTENDKTVYIDPSNMKKLDEKEVLDLMKNVPYHKLKP